MEIWGTLIPNMGNYGSRETSIAPPMIDMHHTLWDCIYIPKEQMLLYSTYRICFILFVFSKLLHKHD